jgi:hypothetical protein
MARLSDAQIAGLAKEAGLSGENLVTAVAVALAESAGGTDVLGPRTRYGRAVGLWQIMPLPGRPSPEALKDPHVNAQQMAKISNGGTDWTPWEAYTNGSYKIFLPRARKAANNADPSGVGSSAATSGVVQAGFGGFPGEIVSFFEFITDPVTWMRAGMLIGGGLLLVFALAQISNSSGAGKLAGAITDVIPQTRALKMAAKAA